jgi:hypothetical protein
VRAEGRARVSPESETEALRGAARDGEQGHEGRRWWSPGEWIHLLLARWRRRRRLTPAERRALVYWVPVAVAIGAVELAGALSGAFRDFVPWPTISSTIGHLEEAASWVGVVVVGVIVVAAYAALKTQSGRDWADPDRPMATDPSGIEAVELRTRRRALLRYGWPTVFLATGLIAFVVHLIDGAKYVLGYAIYGSFLVVGILIPIVLVHRAHRATGFPSLLVALSALSRRFRPTPVIILAGLAILVLHLALYPWPDLTRESASYAGLKSAQARTSAIRAVGTARAGLPPLVYSAHTRGIAQGHEAWLVYFSPASGSGALPYSGCVVLVTKSTTEPSPECLQ